MVDVGGSMALAARPALEQSLDMEVVHFVAKL